jgi:hypothetical protein
MNQVSYPEDFAPHTQESWEDLILDPVEFKTRDEIMEFLADDEMKHHEMPSEVEIDAMALSESQEYQIAHS